MGLSPVSFAGRQQSPFASSPIPAWVVRLVAAHVSGCGPRLRRTGSIFMLVGAPRPLSPDRAGFNDGISVPQSLHDSDSALTGAAPVNRCNSTVVDTARGAPLPYKLKSAIGKVSCDCSFLGTERHSVRVACM